MLPKRLLSHRVTTAAGCWEWTRSRTEHGYGRISWLGKIRRVHRVVAHLVFGLDLDDPARVCHTCDNPPCFNPGHLFISDQAGNVADMVAKGRAAGGDRPHEFCDKGHALVGENIKPDKRGRRRCRQCARDYHREWIRAYNQRKKTIRALSADPTEEAL